MVSASEPFDSQQTADEEAWLTELQTGFESEVFFVDLWSQQTVMLGGFRITPITSPITGRIYGIALMVNSVEKGKDWIQGVMVKIDERELPPSKFAHLQLRLAKMTNGRTWIQLLP